MSKLMCPMVKVLTDGGRVIAGRIIAGEGGEVGGGRKKGSKNKAPRKDKGVKRSGKAPSAYNLFVKENIKSAQGSTPREKMASVAKMWKAQK